jgi:hypothetical protein
MRYPTAVFRNRPPRVNESPSTIGFNAFGELDFRIGALLLNAFHSFGKKAF